jgi:hypothetical protein
MRPARLLLAALLLMAGCAAEPHVAETVPARPVVDRADRHSAAAALEPPALPTTDVLVHGHPELVEHGERALELIDYPWETLGWRMHFLPPQPGHLGLTLVAEQQVEVYVRPEMTDHELAAVIAHELGHVVDLTMFDDDDRARWLELRGLPEDTPWWPCEGCTDYDTGAGDFAEVFAHWLAPGHIRGLLAPPPDGDDLAELMPLLEPTPAHQ